jgi:hypothetical protein
MSSIGETYAVRGREGIFLQVERKILPLPHGVSGADAAEAHHYN